MKYKQSAHHCVIKFHCINKEPECIKMLPNNVHRGEFLLLQKGWVK